MTKSISTNVKLEEINDLGLVESANYRNIDRQKVETLAASILKVGQLEPVQVLKVDSKSNSKYFLIAGHHRFEAIKKINMEYSHLKPMSVSAIVVKGNANEVKSKKFMIQSVVSNEAREESNIVDRARGYAILRESGMSVREISDAVGKSRRVIEKCLQVDGLPDEIKDFISANGDHVKDGLVYSLAARFARGDNVTVEDLSPKTSKKVQPINKKTIKFEIEELVKALKSQKIPGSKIDLILKSGVF